MKALTIRQPWAWAIIFAGKDVENRSWSPNYRGALLIHAGAAYETEADATVRSITGRKVPDGLLHGAIIGEVELVDVIKGAKSPWAQSGKYHWVLKNPRAIEPAHCKGKLGLWTIEHRELPPHSLPRVKDRPAESPDISIRVTADS